jgi:hypothetical protein
MCTNAVVREQRKKPHGHFPIDRNLQLDFMSFEDDLASTASAEYDLESAICNLHAVDVSAENSQVTAFRGKEPVPS